jgi:hypothetical protein
MRRRISRGTQIQNRRLHRQPRETRRRQAQAFPQVRLPRRVRRELQLQEGVETGAQESLGIPRDGYSRNDAAAGGTAARFGRPAECEPARSAIDPRSRTRAAAAIGRRRPHASDDYGLADISRDSKAGPEGRAAYRADDGPGAACNGGNSGASAAGQSGSSADG